MRELSFLKIIQKELNQVEQELLNQVSSTNSLSKKVSKYILRSGGKRLRPALLLLSAKHFDCIEKSAIQLATALELVHTASLLHDDVVDEASLRRGTPSVNSVWGNRVSILVGDFLFSKASFILSHYSRYRVIKTFSKTMIKMAEGELLQMSKSKNMNTTEKDYIEIVDKKTADLTSMACKIGASIGGAKKQEVESFERFGRQFGIAFQIIDDTLDYTSTEREFGKSIGSDLKEGKITLPLIYLLKNCKPSERAHIYNFLQKKGEAISLPYIHNLIHKYRAIDYSMGIARRFAQNASSALKNLKASPALNSLLQLNEYILDRRY